MSAKCFRQAFWSKSSNGRSLLKRFLKGRPLLRYKDTCKMALQRSEVLNEWNAVVNDRDKWKALIQNVWKEHNQERKADYEKRR